MKELSIEEKAKRYDESIKRLEDIKTGKCLKTFMFTEGLFDYLFPELKENEDERTRRKMIKALEECGFTHFNDEFTVQEAIAWLKRQGELVKHYEDKLDKCACDNFNKGYKTALEKQDGQKQEWSDEDLISLGYLATFVDENGDSFYGKNKPNVVKWIRSFANRTPTKKQVWSEEDENAIGMAIIALNDLYDEDSPDTTYGGYNLSFNKAAERLKSLKGRYAWKPSDEQMKALSAINVTGGISYAGQGQELINLYNDLGKLKG